MNRLKIFVIMALLSLSFPMAAQRFSVSTNLLEDACLATLNAELSYSFSQKWSLLLGAKYNPFTYKAAESGQFQIRQKSFALGAKMWPWHNSSGWWIAGKLRYQEYNWGGIFKKESQEGDRFGLGLYAGYTYMLSSHFNLDFGLGFWGGLDIYKRYSCSYCGLTIASGRKSFILPDDIKIALAYVF